ncbi:Alpha/Beta hydrolase protein [Chaetomium sp. MPI-CAGE-AT-0009]|nr:Alpha/Beta hydrolase protein [Chaetomium sp. MPI-CAGE-AT-0009]
MNAARTYLCGEPTLSRGLGRSQSDRIQSSIFLPSSYDQTSHTTLPTLFTIHGGGFCIGHQRDDDEWNRAFANTQSALVISLNYSKAPAYPFPTALHDLEALLLAALADASLPIDRTDSPTSRTAILGFSAGANLALSVSQLPSIRNHPLTPAAAITIYGSLDVSYPPSEKLHNRPWKPSLPSPRGSPTDGLIGLAAAFDWSYIPYGQALHDPLLSPHHAPRAALPPYVCAVAAELDMLAHESWRVACRLSREGGGAGRGSRVVPDRESADPRWRVCGNWANMVTTRRGELIGLLPGREDERFAFEESWEGGGVKWLLVPDVLHGFDNPHIRAILGGAEAMWDAEIKTRAYMAEVGRWLREVVWRL